MTYNWNTMVEITVPTGTNGWLYSGEVIINGVKVRFPVGTPTSVPEPAAVLLKKMIELEQEEDANTAKPQNHYVGDVTIPAGKTLTLEKGAKFVDNSGPSEVVILPETVVTVVGDENLITTAPNAKPEVGAVCKVTYNGTAYDCPALALPEGAPMSGVALGNSDVMGVPGGNATAPFLVLLFDELMDLGEGNFAYGMFVPMEEIAEGAVVTLSIVQIEGAASGGESAGGGGGVFTITATYDGENINDVSHTYEEAKQAFLAGKHVQLLLDTGGMYLSLRAIMLNDDGAQNAYLHFEVNLYQIKTTYHVEYRGVVGKMVLTTYSM